MFFSKVLIHWYLQNQRDLPWRKTKDPYRIWLSEIMLQQTRVAQGLPYFLKFVDAFPTVFDLAKAEEQRVLKLWQGLGYYSRARNLHFTAKYIAEELNGKFPNTFSELKKLKGVGDYTAAAIASICFDEPAAVVDGNVYRVLARYFGIHTPINSTPGIKEFKILAQELIDPNQPANYNQAIMDFGALHCKPKNPLCSECDFNETCWAYRKAEVEKLPVKEKKIKIKHRYFNYLVIVTDDGNTLLEEREGNGIWKGLYQFPLVESKKEIEATTLTNLEEFQERIPKDYSISLFNDKAIVHKLSHQHLHTRFWIITSKQQDRFSIPWKTVEDYPVPVLISNFLKVFRQEN